MIEKVGFYEFYKKNNKGLVIILSILMAGTIILAGILLFFLKETDLIHNKKVISLLFVVLAVIVISFISLMRKWASFIMLFVNIATIIALLFASFATFSYFSYVSYVSTKNPHSISTYNIIVFKDSKINNLEDLANKKIGYPAQTEEANVEKIKYDIKDKASSTSFIKEDSSNILFNNLKNNNISAILINDELLSILYENKNSPFYNEKDNFKIIYSVDIKNLPLVKDASIKEDDNLNSNIISVYISGIDTYGDISKTSRSDVNILAIMNIKENKVLLINTPRDYYVPHPKSAGINDKLTHAGLYGVDNSMSAISKIYGTNVEYYLRMNFTGFENIINDIGGIDVYSDYAFTSSVNRKVSFNAGFNHLNGKEALLFARERYAFSDGDHQRGRDQMAIVTATLKKIMSSPNLLLKDNNLMNDLTNAIQTSIPTKTIFKLLNEQIKNDKPLSIESVSVTGTGELRTTYSIPDEKAYVMIPDKTSIDNVKEKIKELTK